MKCSKHSAEDAVGACVYCGKFFCKDCLVEVKGKMYCKDDLSKVFDEAKEKSGAASTPQNIVINNSSSSSASAAASAVAGGMGNYQNKNKMVALVLCVFLGWLGGHRFYVGKSGSGILYLCTLGLFGFGIAIDFLLIITGAWRDSAGYPLV